MPAFFIATLSLQVTAVLIAAMSPTLFTTLKRAFLFPNALDYETTCPRKKFKTLKQFAAFTADPNKASPLAGLPTEIRLEIFKYLLVLPESNPARCTHGRISASDSLHPAVLRTCRQFHVEALSVLYGANTFIAHHTKLTAQPRLRPWMHAIPASAPGRALIKRWWLPVRLDETLWSPTMDASLADEQARIATLFSHSRALTISVWFAGPSNLFGGTSIAALRKYESIRSVGSASVTCRIPGFENYVSHLEASLAAPSGMRFPLYECQDAVEQKRLSGWTQPWLFKVRGEESEQEKEEKEEYPAAAKMTDRVEIPAYLSLDTTSTTTPACESVRELRPRNSMTTKSIFGGAVLAVAADFGLSTKLPMPL